MGAFKRPKHPERPRPWEDLPPYPFDFVARQEWGAALPTKTITLQHPLDHYGYKFTSTDPCRTRKDCLKKVQDLQKLHMLVKGYDDIGYNFIIGGDLRVYEGTGWFYKSTVIHERYDKFDGKTLNIGYMGNPHGGIERNFYCSEILELRDALVEYGIAQQYMVKKVKTYNV